MGACDSADSNASLVLTVEGFKLPLLAGTDLLIAVDSTSGMANALAEVSPTLFGLSSTFAVKSSVTAGAATATCAGRFSTVNEFGGVLA